MSRRTLGSITHDKNRWELIGTDSGASTTYDFTWAGRTYRQVVLIVAAMRPVTDDVEIWLRTSTDGGSTYGAGATDYKWSLNSTESTTPANVPEGDNSDSEITMSEVTGATDAVGNAVAEGWSGYIQILFPARTTPTRILFHGDYTSAAAVSRTVVGSGQHTTFADVDGVRLLFESGNITSGDAACYGLL